MMDWTDRHCRYFHRQLSKKVKLYTEMITADAILHGDRDKLLSFHPDEHPLALQLGGSDPDKLASAAQIGQAFGYDEINLNIGCPSDRVQSGRFGACLMKEARLVKDCVVAMRAACDLPVSVKCRIGIDDQSPEQILPAFLSEVSKSGCDHFIIHARKAWLKGLSPKENREIPPLDYPLARKMKRQFPELKIILNGGLTDLSQAATETHGLDGAMFGREAYTRPALLLGVDSSIRSSAGPNSAFEAALAMRDYLIEHARPDNGNIRHITRHMLGLFKGEKGAKSWRQNLSAPIVTTSDYDRALDKFS